MIWGAVLHQMDLRCGQTPAAGMSGLGGDRVPLNFGNPTVNLIARICFIFLHVAGIGKEEAKGE